MKTISTFAHKSAPIQPLNNWNYAKAHNEFVRNIQNTHSSVSHKLLIISPLYDDDGSILVWLRVWNVSAAKVFYGFSLLSSTILSLFPINFDFIRSSLDVPSVRFYICVINSELLSIICTFQLILTFFLWPFHRFSPNRTLSCSFFVCASLLILRSTANRESIQWRLIGRSHIHRTLISLSRHLILVYPKP